MKKGYLSFKILVFLLTAFLILTAGGIIFYLKKPVTPEEEQPTDTEKYKEGKGVYEVSFASLIEEKPLDIKPSIPQYKLPLKKGDIYNFDDFIKKFPLSKEAVSMLLENGFVVVDTPFKEEGGLFTPLDSFSRFYQELLNKDILTLITPDTILHYYHLFFDATLSKLEKTIFFDDLWEINKVLLQETEKEYNKKVEDPLIKEALLRNMAYFSAALSLLRPQTDQILTKEEMQKEFGYICEQYGYSFDSEDCKNAILSAAKTQSKKFLETEAKAYTFKIPEAAEDLVLNELKLIEKHEEWEFSPIFIYKEDYSQYIPRGHYTDSEKLKNYFKAMMYQGRITMLLNGAERLKYKESDCGADGIISKEDAAIQTIQAMLITKDLEKLKLIGEKWSKINAITSFLIGYSDDLGPYQYLAELKKTYSDLKVTDSLKLPLFKENMDKVLYNPMIYSGLGGCELTVTAIPPLTPEERNSLKEQAKKILYKTKGFRLFGQKFVLDSYLFSEIVSPYSGEYTGGEKKPFTWVKTRMGREVRGFPRGLDLMALLGSNRALEILKELKDTDYNDFKMQFDYLKGQVDSIPEGFFKETVYMNWLYSLKPLLTVYSDGYQTYMRQKVYQDKLLTTALASWAQLRHDTILYVKQSYTMAERGGPFFENFTGYVEPLPEFYKRLLYLSDLTHKGLIKYLSEEDLKKIDLSNYEYLYRVIERLLEISKRELLNSPLEKQDYDFIGTFNETLDNLIMSLLRDREGGNMIIDENTAKLFKPMVIADVHTDGNTKQVLEEGVGYIKTMIAAIKLPDSKIVLVCGPVFSYYEFKQPMENRLTDEEWRSMLKENPPQEPLWVKNFKAP